MARRILLPLALVFLSGCGITLQTVLGWSEEDRAVRKTVHKRVEIETEPANAQITRRAENGGEVVLGASPLVDTVEYQVDEKTTSTKALGLLLGGAVELAAGTAGWMAGRGKEKCFEDGTCFRTEEPNTTVLGISGTLIALGAIDLIVAASHGFEEDQVETQVIDPPAYAYLARKEGFREAGSNLELAKSERVVLALDPLPVPKAPVVVEKKAVAPASKTWVIAVMDLAVNDSRIAELAIDPSLVKSVADQVRVFVAGRGYRTVDVSAQGAELEKRIEEAKLESYKECYEETCQIELGKALAASHIVRASISRFGSKCVLNAELVDLKEEVVTRGASSTGDCLAEGFLTMSETVAKNLLP